MLQLGTVKLEFDIIEKNKNWLMGNISKQTDCKISNLKISVLDPDQIKQAIFRVRMKLGMVQSGTFFQEYQNPTQIDWLKIKPSTLQICSHLMLWSII